jgi:protein N-terminal amidase
MLMPSLEPGSLDLLVLPEMCLSGYMFNSATAILPYLEPPRIGPTSLLARSLARRLRCHVVAGYPEALPTAPVDTDADRKINNTSTTARSGSANEADASGEASTSNLSLEETVSDTGPPAMKELEGEGTGVGYNSAVIVGPQGDVVGNYRKTFRFDTDKSWAREGEGFRHFDLPEPLGRTAVGICMGTSPRGLICTDG